MRIKILLVLSAVAASIVAGGPTNAVAGKCSDSSSITIDKNKGESNETFLARLKRLDFNASSQGEKMIRISISGGDVPVYVSAKAERDVSGNVYYTAFKLYGKWYIPKSEQSSKLLRTKDSQKNGWQLLPVDGQCVVMYIHKIKNDVSDSKLVEDILSIQRMNISQLPIRINDKYQRRWSSYLLVAIIMAQEEKDEKMAKDYKDFASYCRHSPFNQDNRDKTMDLINSFDKCPEDLKQAAKDYVDAHIRLISWSRNLTNRKPDTSIEDAAEIGASLGSLNEDNPLGGALVGGLFGALIGAAHQEEQRETIKSEYDSLMSDMLTKRTKFLESAKRNVDVDKIKDDQQSGQTPLCDINEE